MALTGVAQYLATRPVARVSLMRANLAVIAGRLSDGWVNAPFNGSPATAPVVPTATTVGALIGAPSGVATWIKKFTTSQTPGSTFMLFDRLSHQGGLSGIVSGTVTTNLPTAALTRYTSGVGVMMGVSIYTAVGTTATTLSVSYTNSAGVAGRTSPLITFGGTDRATGTFIPIPFQVGDVGARSIESVTLAASTLTAGAYGVTLWKPLGIAQMSFLARGNQFDNVRDMGAWFENVPADACLCFLQGNGSVQTWPRSAAVELIRQV